MGEEKGLQQAHEWLMKGTGAALFSPQKVLSFFESLSQFGDARYWVEKNKYRFRFDAPYLVENWGKLK